MQRKTPNLTHAQELAQMRSGRDLRELLIQRYVREGRTMTEIGQELGVTRDTVGRWLGHLGISREDRADPKAAVA